MIPPKPGTKITGKTEYGLMYGDGIIVGYDHIIEKSYILVYYPRIDNIYKWSPSYIMAHYSITADNIWE